MFLLLVFGANPVVSDVLKRGDNEWVRGALKAASLKKWKTTERYAKRIKTPLMQKTLLWVKLTRSPKPQNFEELSSFLTNNPDWPEQKKLIRRAEQSFSASPNADRVMSFFASREPISNEGMERFGAALISGGKLDEGRAMIRRAWVLGNFTKVREKNFYKKNRRYLKKADNIARLDRLLWEGRYWASRRMLWKVNKDYQALGWARLSLRFQKGNVDRLIAKVPQQLKSDPGLTYERLRWRRKKGKENVFVLLEGLPKDLRRPSLWWKEQAVLVRKALEQGFVSRAYKIAASNKNLKGVDFADSQWLSGWVSLRFLNDNDIAFGHFKAMFEAVKYPISRARAAYWAGRAQQALGDEKQASYWYGIASNYGTTYYGQLAAQKNNPGESIPLDEEPEFTSQEKAEFDQHELVQVVRMLDNAKASDWVKPFILQLQKISTAPGWQALTAALAREYKRFDVSITVAKRADRKGLQMPLSGYPALNLPALPKRVKTPRPETPLVLAVVRQESAFRVRSQSNANARGLMQILPRTARKVAKKYKVRYSSTKLNRDGRYNLMLGQAYLSGLLNDFKGSYVLSLAAYNAGPGRVRQWIRRFGDPRQADVNAIDWVEMIPFNETRNYVQRVLENLQVYRSRLADEEIALNLEGDL